MLLAVDALHLNTNEHHHRDDGACHVARHNSAINQLAEIVIGQPREFVARYQSLVFARGMCTAHAVIPSFDRPYHRRLRYLPPKVDDEFNCAECAKGSSRSAP